jgi:hypothetical protein
MQKMYIIGITVGVAAVAVAVAVAVVIYTQSQYSVNILVSLEKTTVNYGDTQTWSVKGLPPNADYIATVRWASTALIVNTGTANNNGEANGSFPIGPTIAPGTVMLRVELASDATNYGETSMNIALSSGELSGSILLSVEKTTVNYGDTQTWSVKGLPPNADYIATVRFADTALIVNIGTADVNGEATDSFVIGPNIPPGTLAFRIEIASDPGTFDEITLNLVP